MKRLAVESSALAAIGYDPVKKALEIEFHHGAIYRYDGVPDTLFQRLWAAESKGAFFHNHILDAFPYVLVPRPRPFLVRTAPRRTMHP